MQTISQDMLTKIKESVNIADVIGGYVSLIPRGKNYFCICHQSYMNFYHQTV